MKINETLGGKTLVHCMYGISRSVSICVAYLMRYQELIGRNSKLTVEEAVSYIRGRRCFAKPNRGFMAQLLSYEKYLQEEAIPDEYEHVTELSDAIRHVQETAFKTMEEITDLLKEFHQE